MDDSVTGADDAPGSGGGAGPGAAPARRRRRGRAPWARPLRHPWLSAFAVLVVLTLLVEGWVRWVKPQLPVVRSGDAAEMVLKARRLHDLGDAGPAPDVMFFGTSMMDSAIAPKEFLGASKQFRSAYNASVVGAPAATEIRWVNDVALAELQPKVVVVGVHPIDLLLTDPLNLNIQPGQADVVFSRVERELRSGPLGDIDRAVNEHVELVAQRGSLRQPKVMAEATWNQFVGNEPKKYIPLREEDDWRRYLQPDGTSGLFTGKRFQLTKAVEQLRANMQRKDFSAEDVNRLLDALVARTSTWGGKVVVFIPPVPLDAWRQGSVDLESLRYGTRLIIDAARARGLEVIDFSERSYPNELFADVVHANDRGAEQISRDLVVEMERQGR